MKKLFQLLPFYFLAVVVTSCMSSTEDINKGLTQDEADSYSDINPTNFTESTINIALKNDYKVPVDGVLVSLLTDSPLKGGETIFKGITDENGSLTTTYNVPNHLNSLILKIGYLGLPDYLVIPVERLDEISINGFDHSFESLDEELIPGYSYAGIEPKNSSGSRTSATSTISAIGSFNFMGTPDYLLERDVISSELLEFVNTSLPESKPVPEFHPAYLNEDAEANLHVVEDADIWMTFVTEGAGYRNSLGYYYYDTENPPATADDIDTLHIGFPNASHGGYGGQLRSGDKIHLGKFSAGTTIGFVLIADGFNIATSSIKGNADRYYSNSDFNPEADDLKKQHTVTLWDDVNQLFLIGFEDMNREWLSVDNDFNDAVFYISANPIEAIDRENINPIDKPVDADGDGVNDTYDEFPEDIRYAYKYSYPGDDSYGTFVFEDQWPGYGDYDFNDLVVDYQYEQYANSINKIVLLRNNFILKAAGAGFRNAFGISLDVNPLQIASVTGNKIHGDLFNFNLNGTESGQSKSIIIATDDVHKSFGANGLVNTDESLEYIDPDTINVNVEFTLPLESNEIGAAPFNPFLVINQTRGRELHLPGYLPSDLVNTEFFGQGNDGSKIQESLYYISKKGLPWGMNLPVTFEYPKEKTDVRIAYNHFDQWAKSSGFTYMDWYTSKSGYRNTDKVYSKR